MTIRVRAAALQISRREVEEAHEMVNHSVKLLIRDQPAERSADLEVAHRTNVLQRGKRDRRQPHFRPGKGRDYEQRQLFAAEDLVTDGFVEKHRGRQANGPPFSLIKDSLRLEEERLAEPFSSNDDELVIPVGP
jgi:hypothetical protein